ncbi:MAG: 2-C-methyl-D-erythritol 2,4-cyclodiphosphate synthase, partial [Dehalococcoidia bacterium]
VFPPGDPATRGADSMLLLREIVARVQGGGWTPVNLDVTVIAERPRLAPRVTEMRAAIAAAIGVDAAAVSVKGKTNEGLDSVGRGEAVAVHAVALLSRVTDAG